MKRVIPRLEGQAKRIAKGELVGLDVRISAANDAGLVGLQGQIVDETLKTLTLRQDGPGGRRIVLAKAGTTWTVTTPQGEVDVDGRALEFRPQDRTKKVR